MLLTRSSLKGRSSCRRLIAVLNPPKNSKLSERRLVDRDRTGGVTLGDAGDLFHIEDFPAAQPIQRFLQQPDRQVTDRLRLMPAPAQRTALDMPEDLLPRLFHAHDLTGVFVEQVGEGLRPGIPSSHI